MTDKSWVSQKPLVVHAWDVREDFELACIREFSHSGLQLGIGVSREQRRERIRAAILREGKADLRWRNSEFTYGNMYTRVYRQWLGDGGIDDAERTSPAPGDGRAAMQDAFAGDEESLEGDDWNWG